MHYYTLCFYCFYVNWNLWYVKRKRCCTVPTVHHSLSICISLTDCAASLPLLSLSHSLLFPKLEQLKITSDTTATIKLAAVSSHPDPSSGDTGLPSCDPLSISFFPPLTPLSCYFPYNTLFLSPTVLCTVHKIRQRQLHRQRGGAEVKRNNKENRDRERGACWGQMDRWGAGRGRIGCVTWIGRQSIMSRPPESCQPPR